IRGRERSPGCGAFRFEAARDRILRRALHPRELHDRGKWLAALHQHKEADVFKQRRLGRTPHKVGGRDLAICDRAGARRCRRNPDFRQLGGLPCARRLLPLRSAAVCKSCRLPRMSAPGKTAVLLLAHGSPESVEEVPDFLLRVTGGRPLPPDAIEEVKRRYKLIGRSPLTEITLKQGELLAA